MQKNAILFFVNAYIALMDLQQIRYFLALADELHFWKTAGKMNITQSALSRQIMALETDLGVQLFERNKRNVKLTHAGKFLKERWSKELTEINHIHQFAKEIHLGESGTIRIAHPDSISGLLMPEIVSGITKRYPKLQIELVQVLYENQHEFLTNYKVDLEISRDNSESKEIQSKVIFTDHLALVLPSNHPLKSLEQFLPETMNNEIFILPIKNDYSSYNMLINQAFESIGVKPKVFIHSEIGSTIIALVKKGLGIAIIPDSYAHHEIPGVQFIKLPIQTNLHLNWRTNDNNPVLSNVLKLILEQPF